jgi:hypothetical protein
MITFFKNIIISLIFSLFLLTPNISHAEVEASLSLVPKNPAPYSSVTLTVNSYSFDVNTADITWKSGDVILLAAQGAKSLTVQTGGIGSKLNITVLMETKAGVRVEQTVTITPESVSLIYESPESYIPLFYEGLALPSDGARVQFTALPQMNEDGTILSPKKIAYSWYVNDMYLKENSGIGKQTATIPLDILTESTQVKVITRSQDGGMAEKTIQVYPHQVLPLLYGYDEILGIDYSKLYTKRIESTKDFTIALEPYYFSTNGELADTALIEWTLNDLPVTPLGGRILSLHPKANTYGSKVLSITLSNTKRRIQKAIAEIAVVFDTR